ncbi:hypothetical protein M378DRAFT_22346 [Amanita muscaria Koide BX008]|uniref:Uncharacterized protein n=1 Tax=Amanita muscaria (strain Koide BX008) TaxID=946122 RepID=A0A0C2SXL6_AMAMK|nr:hypothetical protein M378DRAFT_22346 [Amanita muscaria Koide BX008]
MPPASQTRLFNPLLENPLHGGNGGSESSSEGSRMLIDNVSPQQTLKSILRSPDALPSNHHTTAINTNNVTMADKDINTFIPTLPMKLIPAFLLVDGQVEQLPGVVPVLPLVSGLSRPLSSPSRPNLENITRLNLRSLMLSKGIIASPAAAIPPVQAVPQAQELIPPKPLYTLQPPLPFCNILPAPTFPNNQITIQVAQPPVLQNIGLNNRIRELEHIPPEGECVVDSGQLGTAPASENHINTENVGSMSVPQSAPKQPHKRVGHTPGPFANPQKKTPARGTHRFSPYDKGKRRQTPKIDKLKVVKWKNSLTRLWYLLERGGYNEKNHQILMSLLSEMKENRSQVTLEWLNETKVAEYLAKFKREESIFDCEPLVRKMAGRILQFWSRKFRIPLS